MNQTRTVELCKQLSDLAIFEVTKVFQTMSGLRIDIRGGDTGIQDLM